MSADADLLPAEERIVVEASITALRAAVAANDAGAILARIEALDEATKAWAGRRMDRAIQAALAGQQIDTVERTVASARGVDAHVEEHLARQGGR